MKAKEIANLTLIIVLCLLAMKAALFPITYVLCLMFGIAAYFKVWLICCLTYLLLFILCFCAVGYEIRNTTVSEEEDI